MAPDDLQQDFDDAANLILGRAGPGITVEQPEPQPDAQPEPQGDVPEGGMVDAAGRLRDAETGAYTTEAALQRKYADRFDTPEELEQSWLDLNSKVGSMANEVGQWRQMGEALQQQLQQQNQPGYMSDDELSQWDEYAVERPLEAAEKARQSGNQMLYERVMDTWYTEDPKAASRYETTVALTRYQQMQEERLGPALQPLQDQYRQQSFSQAVLAARAQLPDFDTVIGNDQALQTASAILGGPAFIQGLNNAQTVDEKIGGLTLLYHVARSVGHNQVPTQPVAAQPTVDPAVNRIQATLASPNVLPQGRTVSTAREALDDLWEQGMASYNG